MRTIREIIKFLYESGQLKRVQRSGWWLAGIKNVESVAEHVYRACVVGWILAGMERVNPERVVSLLVFHDLAETRLNDLHKVSARYIDKDKVESQIIREQTTNLPDSISKDIQNLFREFESGTTKEAIVARDAEYLETALQAREYTEQGFKSANDWIQNVRKLVRTESAKKLVNEIGNVESTSWWKGLKRF